MAIRYQKLNKRRAPKKRAYKKKPAKKAFKKMIRKAITSFAEKKTIGFFQNGTSLISTANGSWDATNVRAIGPPSMVVSQGTGQGERIGNRIKVTKMLFKGVLVPLAYDVSSNPLPQPQQIRMVFFYEKSTPTSTPAPRGNFLQLGSTTVALQNDLIDMQAQFNTDRYRILGTRNFKLGFAKYDGTGADPANQGYGNNDYKLNCNFSVDITKMIPKNAVYDDASCQTRNLWVAFILARADGLANLSAYVPVGLQYTLDMFYTDV